MSTRYSFVNRKERKIKAEFDKLINSLTNDLGKEVNSFFEKKNLEEEVPECLKMSILNQLNELYQPEEIDFCTSTRDNIYFTRCKYFSNFRELQEFFENNKDVYLLEDEYENEYLSWEEFVKHIDVDTRVVIWIV